MTGAEVATPVKVIRMARRGIFIGERRHRDRKERIYRRSSPKPPEAAILNPFFFIFIQPQENEEGRKRFTVVCDC